MNPSANMGLVRAVDEALQGQPDLRTSQVQVAAENGTITLEGWVDDIWMAVAIERRIADVPGVTRVRNRLKIRMELGDEATAMQTEFGTANAARFMMGRGRDEELPWRTKG